jgi:hypothetical protein
MRDFFTEHLALHSKVFADYADLFAMGLCLVITSKLNEMILLINKNNFSSFSGYWYKRISSIK